MNDTPGVLSTVIAAQAEVPFGALFRRAVHLARKDEADRIHAEAEPGHRVATAYTTLLANPGLLNADCIEINGGARRLPDSEDPDQTRPIPTIAGAHAAVMLISAPSDIDLELRGAFHANAIVELTGYLDAIAVPWSWTTDLGRGPTGAFEPWSDTLLDLDRLGDPMLWTGVVR
jgi:hypothetical protein